MPTTFQALERVPNACQILPNVVTGGQPSSADLEAFRAVVAARRGRPLILQPVPGLSAGAPCGLWISVPTADYVCYDPDTSRLHAEHIVLHELGHMLSGHRTGIDAGGGALARLVPDIDPRTIDRILGRMIN